MKELIERTLGKVQDIAGEYIFSATVQVFIIRFWKRVLFVFVIVAIGCVNFFMTLAAKIKDFSLEKVVIDYPYSVIIFIIFALWIIAAPIGKISKK
jgi:hypothetical protein